MRKMLHKICDRDFPYLFFVYTFLFLFTICLLYPLIYVVSASFSSPEALIQGRVILFPVEPGLQGYQAVFKMKKIWNAYANTIVYTVVATVIGTSVTMVSAYILSRKEFPARNTIVKIYTLTMFIGGGTIPTYLWLRDLHLLDTMWALVLPGALSVYHSIVGRTFIQSTVPEELYEATLLDGGSYFQHFSKVVMPLSKAVIAVIALNYALGMWNSYYAPMLYLNDSSKYTLQVVLRELLLQNQFDATDMTIATSVENAMEAQHFAELLKYSLIVVASLPMLIVYPFLQKYFVKGVMIGSVKG